MSVSIKNSVSGGGGGISSDEVTAVASDVLKGKTYVGNDTNDEIRTGTLELTGNAAVGDVLSGSTFYNTNAKSKQTGTLALSGNATPTDVLAGKTFYNTNAKSKQTGSLGSTELYLKAPSYRLSPSKEDYTSYFLSQKKYTIAEISYGDSRIGWDIYNATFDFTGSRDIGIKIYCGLGSLDTKGNAVCYLLIEKKGNNPKFLIACNIGLVDDNRLLISRLAAFDTPYIDLERSAVNVKTLL